MKEREGKARTGAMVWFDSRITCQGQAPCRGKRHHLSEAPIAAGALKPVKFFDKMGRRKF
jgi:hypothetical protein